MNPGSWVIKSRVMMGGRGKAGGIEFADSPAQGATFARALIGKVFVNEQSRTRSGALAPRRGEAANRKEAYVSIAIDRAAKKPVIIVTAQGGMDVEEVAAHDPAAVSKYWLDPAIGLQPFAARQLAFEAKLPSGYRKAFPKVLAGLYDLFMDYGANLVEIDPLILTPSGDVIASDAKVELDDNALYKHPDSPPDVATAPLTKIKQPQSRSGSASPTTPSSTAISASSQRRGSRHGHDGRHPKRGRLRRKRPRNRRRRASRTRQKQLPPRNGRSKSQTDVINIMGGITRDNQVARGIVDALTGGDLREVPHVVRLTGTNEKEGRDI